MKAAEAEHPDKGKDKRRGRSSVTWHQKLEAFLREKDPPRAGKTGKACFDYFFNPYCDTFPHLRAKLILIILFAKSDHSFCFFLAEFNLIKLKLKLN